MTNDEKYINPYQEVPVCPFCSHTNVTVRNSVKLKNKLRFLFRCERCKKLYEGTINTETEKWL